MMDRVLFVAPMKISIRGFQMKLNGVSEMWTSPMVLTRMAIPGCGPSKKEKLSSPSVMVSKGDQFLKIV